MVSVPENHFKILTALVSHCRDLLRRCFAIGPSSVTFITVMSGDEFVDEPLYEPLHTIRLLRLPWGEDPSKFDGYLVSFALNSVACPEFIALSYTWGSPPSRSTSINLNGHQFDVLDTLFPFLKLAPKLPEFSSDTWWWIDSICINQEDEKEKSLQMEIMGKIYERAHKTVVWLGEEVGERFDDESRNCTGAIDNLYRLCDEMDAATDKNGSLDNKKLLALRQAGSGINWKAIESLLLRPWWRRVWTLQEFLISNRLTFYCGERRISRRSLGDAVYATWVCKGWDGVLMSQKAFWGAWGRRRINQWCKDRKHEMGLIAMMAYIGDYGATDERDRIYSLLGVAKDSSMIGPLDPKSSVESVYRCLVTSFIKKYNNLDIICYAHLFNSSATKTDTKALPSWVPDWRARVEGKVIPVMASQGSTVATGNFRPAWVLESTAAYKASKDTYPQFSISDDLQVLFCRGVVVDKIDGLGGSTCSDAGDTADLEEEPISFVQSTSEINLSSGLDDTLTSGLTEIISRCIALDRDDRYLADHMVPDSFQTDFETFCATMLENPRLVRKGFRDWFLLNSSLLVRGRTLEEHYRVLQPRPLPSMEDFRHGSLNKFYRRFIDTTATMARRLSITENGHFGMAACRAAKGDVVCVLFGCSVPVLLREQETGTYQFIGECYLDGYMNGEALDRGRGLREVEFRLI